jgi:hypothetical protein
VARTGRPTADLVLSDEERETLQRWVRRPRSAQAVALRARIVLACAEGATNKDVAARLGVTAQTVGKWRTRFVADRLAGLADEDRPGRACQEVCVSPSGEMVDWVVARPPLVIVFHRLSGVNVVRPRCAAGAPR